VKTIRISAVELDLLTPATALAQIKQFLQTPETKYVLTPNAGQLVTYRENLKLRNFLLNANLRLIDGWPLAVAVSLAEGKKWPRVTGSDLLPKLFRDLDNQVRVGIIGGTDGPSVLTEVKISFQI
jgi:Teichoic acid biosynthesis proteins